jgi:hypothetical protein
MFISQIIPCFGPPESCSRRHHEFDYWLNTLGRISDTKNTPPNAAIFLPAQRFRLGDAADQDLRHLAVQVADPNICSSCCGSKRILAAVFTET